MLASLFATAINILAFIGSITEAFADFERETRKSCWENDGVEYVRWIAQDGACGYCDELNGQVFVLGDEPPLQHINCRCELEPVEKNEDFDFNISVPEIISEKHRRKGDDEGIFTTLDNRTKGDVIKPHNIRNNMKTSKIGKETLEYLENEGVLIQLLYNVDNPDNLLGRYEVFSDTIQIFCDKTKTIEKTSQIIIHESVHRKSTGLSAFEEEVECFKAEKLHIKSELTKADIDAIIKEIKENYPELIGK